MLREKKRPVTSAAIDPLISALSQTERWLKMLEVSSTLPADAETAADALIRALADPAAERIRSAAAKMTAIRYRPDPKCYFGGDDPIQLMRKVPQLIEMKLSTLSVRDPSIPYDPFTCTLAIDAVSAAGLDELKAIFRFLPDQVELTPLETASERAEELRLTDTALRTLRVETAKLESLAGLIDELVAAKNGLAEAAAAAGLGSSFASLDRLIGRVHQSVSGLRMVPVSPLLRRFPRLVREMAASVGREVELVIEDSAVEADKDVVEGLFEPLTHLLRNAVDHGVEAADQRLAMGKPARAKVVLAAQETGGRLHIRLSDDGRGIDPARIRALAEERRLVDPERLRTLSDQEAIELIFLPGFSTAATVSALSGRGVGMDAVRSAVQRLGGRVMLSSEAGLGTTIELALPLSVSLTKIIVVADGDQTYGVPMERVLETVRLPAGGAIPIRAGHAFNWRDRTVPLLALSALTGGSDIPHADRKVLVVRAHDQPVGLAIERIVGRLDVAMRPVEGLLTAMPGLAGTTMLGDGRVLVILDPEALVA